MDPAEAGKVLYDSYMAAHTACQDESNQGPHPSKSIALWRSVAAGGPAPGSIQKDADPQPKVTGPTVPAQDGRYTVGSDSVPRFETSDGRVLRGNEAIAARAALSNPTRAAKMASRIKGIDRLK
jgi:hypothetical protein